mmetsp:Transcript_29034/g.78567  ORF Transcript_29034/g.78567 Transcript_29034/m.78567 type:complete len:282 (-) Transcript_29034:567-1412(-)
MGAVTSVDIVPSPTVGGNGLFQVRNPQFAVLGGLGTERAPRPIGAGTQTLVDHDVDLLPGLQIVQGHRILVDAVSRQGMEIFGLSKQSLDRLIVLGKRGNARQQPAITHLALLDVGRIHFSDEFNVWLVAESHAPPGQEGKVVLGMQFFSVVFRQYCVCIFVAKPFWELIILERPEGLVFVRKQGDWCILRNAIRFETLRSGSVQINKLLLILGPFLHFGREEHGVIQIGIFLEFTNPVFDRCAHALVLLALTCGFEASLKFPFLQLEFAARNVFELVWDE